MYCQIADKYISLYQDKRIYMDLESWSQCLKVLADPTRVRLLAILEHEELTVAELASITGLAQPRVSTERI
jgi:DNA-binding transcriptional ArsR family regulator